MNPENSIMNIGMIIEKGMKRNERIKIQQKTKAEIILGERLKEKIKERWKRKAFETEFNF